MSKSKQDRLDSTRVRFNRELEKLVKEMDSASRLQIAIAGGLGVLTLKNGRNVEIQLHVTADREDWIKGK